MPPAFLLLWPGRSRRFFLPLPLFLLWPVLALAWVLVGVPWVLLPRSWRPRALGAAVLALIMIHQLRGVALDLRGGSAGFHMKLV